MVDYHENVYARRGLDGRSHIPALPFWVALIRIAQFILALIVLILAAYASSVFGSDYFPGYGMTFFVFSWTILFLIYIFVTPLWYPELYLYWAHLGLEITTVIFWLVAWALLAQEASAWNAVQGAENAINQAIQDSGVQVDIWSAGNHAIAATKAAAALGAITWLLFVVTLTVFGFFLHKHRVAAGSTGADVEAAEKVPTFTQPPLELNNGVNNGAQHQVSSPAPA